jgi:hypothetical protein
MTGHTIGIVEIVKGKAVFLSVFIALFIVEVDLITGEDIEFPILFAIPVALAAWELKPYLAYSISIALPLLRLGFVLFYWQSYHAFHILAFNVIITIVALIGYTYVINKISLQKRNLAAKVKMLEEKLSYR